ncbi:DUF192 domain-containing protein [Qipengyuania sp. JC766]|uniref:DUF192 domain-containing protein n=1 Tax=Qipengyuania sp. JC766 TaxID=3232139 RepID=UPI00345A1995
MKYLLAISGAFLMAACSPQATSEPAPIEKAAPSTHPVSGLQVIPLTVRTDEGEHQFDVEVARSREEQARGLMFRTELGPNEGMIFIRNPPDVASFWMKNTPLPLDIIFVDPDGTIINIAANTPPYSLDSVSAEGITGTVFEIVGGRAAELGIEAGDTVEY